MEFTDMDYIEARVLGTHITQEMILRRMVCRRSRECASCVCIRAYIPDHWQALLSSKDSKRVCSRLRVCAHVRRRLVSWVSLPFLSFALKLCVGGHVHLRWRRCAGYSKLQHSSADRCSTCLHGTFLKGKRESLCTCAHASGAPQ